MARPRKGDKKPTGERKTFYRQNIDKTNKVISEQVAVVKEEIKEFQKKHKKNKRLSSFPEAYINSGCNKAQAARAVGIARRQCQRWMDKHEDFRELIQDIDESLIDLSESALMMHIVEGNPIANLFHLKTKGRKRGYIEQPRGGASEGGTSFSDGLEMVREQIKNNPRLMRKIEEVLTD
jgi:hypothetical protein